MKTIVIQPGGYHPFHAGHYALYKSAVEAFPGADVYVAATNDQKARPFPFAIKEKLAKIAGVAPGHFVQVSSPFKAAEITSHYNPDQDVLIFVRSEKDRNEQPKPGGMKKDGTPSYFQPYTGKGMQPFSKHAYFAYLPTVEFGPGITSATEIRNAWPTLNPTRKTAMVMSLYPATKQNPQLAANVVKMMDLGMGGQPEVDESKEEALQYATQAHAGQTRAGGAPYISHPISVADSIKQYTKSHNLDALISAALLHDTVEDTDTTHEALHDLFGGLVASLVQELTSDKEKIQQMGKADYLAQKMAAMSSYALVIKLADRLDNVQDIATAKTPEWRAKYRAETEKILDYIEKHRALSGTHQKLIELIRNKLGEIDRHQGVTEDTSSSSLPDVLYHGGEHQISKFRIPPYGVFFSPHKDWAENYGDALTKARVNATKVYVADSDNWNDPNSFDAKVLDALFDRDYKTLAVCVKVLMRRGYQALQTQTDSEMVVVFPGTAIQVIHDVDEQFTTNLTTEGNLNEFYDTTGKYSGGGEGDDARRQRNARKLIAYGEKQGLRPGTVKVGYSSETGVYQITGLAQRHDTEYDWRFKIDPTSRKFVAVDATQTDADYAPDTFAPVVFDDELKEFTTNLTTEDEQGNVSDQNLANIDPEDHGDEEGGFVKNQIHTMLRVLTHLEHAIGDQEDLPEWVEMKISQAQEMIVGVMDFMISDKEQDIEADTGEESLMKEEDSQLSKPIKPFNQVKQYPLTALL